MTWLFNDVTKAIDVSPYVTSITWSGDLSSAGRKLEFAIAYTTSVKDSGWKNIALEVGDRVTLTYTDDKTMQSTPLFNGVIFLQNRTSESYTMEFCAFDNMVYLAKSKMSIKFDKALPKDCIERVCNTLGVTPGDLTKCADLTNGTYAYSNVFDAQAGSEIIAAVLEHLRSWTGWRYHVYMAADKNGKQVLNVVRADTAIDDVITAETNITGAKHGVSIENMVNQVCVVDKDGNATGYISTKDDIDKYGLLQEVYKIDDKKDTKIAAMALLKKQEETSSVEAIGSIQAISGYAIEVQEEQISGKFLISSDSHKIDSTGHTMSLDLVYIVPPENKDATTSSQGYFPAAGANAQISQGSANFGNTEAGVLAKGKALGLSNNQIAGIMGNIKAEDGTYDPAICADGEHVGIFQFSQERWKKYVEWCDKNGNDYYNAGNQLEYALMYENGDIRSQIPDDPQQAASWWNDNIEISGDHSGSRESYAQDYANRIADGSLVPETPKQVTTYSTNGTLDQQLKTGFEAWKGVTMDNGTEGCVEAATKIGSYYSPFLAQEYANGVVYVPTLVADAGDNCIVFDPSKLEEGDVIVYGDNTHVVIAAGPDGSYVGNSSGQNRVVEGSDFYQMDGLYPTKIIKTSHM